MPPLTDSQDYRRGRCGGFDGETTCPHPRGHAGPCRFHDPSGSGRWIDRDDAGVEVARGGPWQPAELRSAAELLDHDELDGRRPCRKCALLEQARQADRRNAGRGRHGAP